VQNEYERACTALRSKKLAESEKHLRKAVQYSPDAFGWVMLGKVLQVSKRWDEARSACTEGVVHDPSYWPAQICLAEIDVRTHRWNASLDESNRALSLSLESKRFAYFVSALALFNLDKVSDAESRALEAKRLDVDHQLPPVHLLLAQIDELKGDLQAAETELRDCLKYAKDSLAGDMAKQELARLDSAPN
jgi:tetratricopeptide (TPR) repeat protein